MVRIALINNAAAGDSQHATSKLIGWFKKENVAVEVMDPSWMPHALQCDAYDGIVLSGSDLRLAESMPSCDVRHLMNTLLRCNKPILGICYGHQLLAFLLGGKVTALPKRRTGTVRVVTTIDDPVVPKDGTYRRWHHDAVQEVPPKWQVLATSSDGVVEAMKHLEHRWWGVQFHPELSDEAGSKLLENFVRISEQP